MSKSQLKRGQNFLILGLLLCVLGEAQGEGTPPALSQVMNTVMHHYMDRVKTAESSGSSTAQLPETRGGHGGGYGGGHGQGHGNGYGAITLDPVSIISLLALGAFLINNILQLLKANQAPAPAPAPAPARRKLGRSFDQDMDNPSKIAEITSKTEKYNDKMGKDGDSGDREPSFSKFFENVGSLYYLQPKKRNVCIKKVVCKYVNGQKSREDASGSFKTKVFDFMLTAITRFVAPELSAQIVREDACSKFNKLCSDSILKDAKISVENKVYAEVSSIISSLAIKQLVG